MTLLAVVASVTLLMVLMENIYNPPEKKDTNKKMSEMLGPEDAKHHNKWKWIHKPKFVLQTDTRAVSEW